MRRLHFLLLLFVAASAFTPPATAAAVGWTPIGNIDDPNVQDLGKWAVGQHNAVNGDHLVFQQVDSGESLAETAGTTYRLRLRASGRLFVAVAFEQLVAGRKLISFDPAP